MKLRNVLAMTLLLPLCTLAAQKTLVVELTTGQTASYLLQEKPVLTMKGTQLHIATATIQTDYERGEVKQFFFTGESTDVREVPKEALQFKQTDTDHLEICGLLKNADITVCDLSGRKSGSVTRTENTAVVSLRGCHNGIYLVKVGKCQTIKIVKK